MPVNVLFLHEFFFKFHALIAIFFLGGCPKFVYLFGYKKGAGSFYQPPKAMPYLLL